MSNPTSSCSNFDGTLGNRACLTQPATSGPNFLVRRPPGHTAPTPVRADRASQSESVSLSVPSVPRSLAAGGGAWLGLGIMPSMARSGSGLTVPWLLGAPRRPRCVVYLRTVDPA